MDEIGEPSRGAELGLEDANRLDALEHQVRQLMTRMATWVEAQLVQAVDDRRADLRALRSELQAVLNEQVATARAESTSMLTVATRRLSVNQEQLGERLDDVAGRATDAAARVAALSLSTTSDTDRIDSLEHQLGQRISRLAESVQAELAESADRRRAQTEVLQAELETALAERLGAVARQSEQTTERVAALRVSFEADAARAAAFEERFRSAMTRLAETMEARLAESAAARLADIDAVRGQLQAAVDERVENSRATTASMLGSVVERVEAIAGEARESAEAIAGLSVSSAAGTARVDELESRVRSAVTRLTEAVDSGVAAAGAGREDDLNALRAELQAALDERVREVAGRAAEAGEGIAALTATAEADALRSQAFEERVRTAVVRLTESVDARLAELVTGRDEEIEELRAEWRASIDAGRDSALVSLRAELQAAVDGRLDAVSESVEAAAARADAFESRVRAALTGLSELIDARLAEVVSGRREEVDALRTELDARVQEVAGQAAHASERFAALTSSVEADALRSQAFEERVRSAVVRLTESIDARLAELVTGRDEEVEELRAEWRAAIDAGRDAVLESFRTELRATLDERVQEVAAQAARASEGVAALTASAEADAVRTEAFEDRVRAAVLRLTESVDARLAEAGAGRAEEVEALRSELHAAIAADRDTVLAGFRAELQSALDERMRGTSNAVEVRMEAFETRVRAALDGLAGSMDTRLAETVAARQAEVEGLRAGLQTAVASSRETTLEAFRAELHATLDGRLQEVADEASRSTGALAALTASAEAETARSLAFEERVRSVVSRLTESVEAIAASTTGRDEIEALRVEMRAALDDRIEAASRQATDGLATLTQSFEAEAARLEAFEHRVRTAMGRLTESVETQLAASAGARQAELEALRSQLGATVSDELADRVGELVDARLADVVERRRAEFQALQGEMQEALTSQLNEARSQIAAAVAGANKRFVRAHEQLGERVEAVAQRADGRLDALEAQAGRTDERIDELVEARVTELTGDVEARMAALMAAQSDEVRAQVDSTVAEADRKLVGTEAHVDSQVAELADQLATFGTGLEAAAAAVAADQGRVDELTKRVRQFEARLAEAVQAQLAESAGRRAAEVAALSAEMADVRAEVAAAAAARASDSRRDRDELRKILEDISGRVDELVAVASAERGALAPLRSDIRLLQTQVSELSEALAEARTRRKGASAPAPVPQGGRAASEPARKAPAAGRSAARKATATKAPPASKRSSPAPKNGQ